ncbi:nucleotidyl transferase AbiEii/AbiGii toxin family protein [Ningiella sp. W23]|uniref:nucleotidyl transferase AbiEii/AbiGii toxin family protein n=1 Tax=Ningiella sp. W23 TaxID=3023715 RepID=UPI003757B9E6
MAHYKRQHHNKIDYVLRSLNADLLSEHECYFAGGTAIALKYNEFRESVDIDFLVSNIAYFNKLRRLLSGRGLAPLLRNNRTIQHTEVKSDRYGIRTSVLVENSQIKFEIVSIDLLMLDTPDPDDTISSVKKITNTDMIATKLIANTFRGQDSAYFNRDILDIVFMDPEKGLLQRGSKKAVDAQGDKVLTSFINSANKLLTDKAWLATCLQKLDIQIIDSLCQAKIKQTLRKLTG